MTLRRAAPKAALSAKTTRGTVPVMLGARVLDRNAAFVAWPAAL
jgi:hypothetical protein